MRLFKVELHAQYARNIEHISESDDQMIRSFDSLGVERYTHHNFFIREMKKDNDKLVVVTDQLREAVKVLDSLNGTVKGSTSLYKRVTPETLLSVSQSEEFLIPASEGIWVSVNDKDLLPSFEGYIAVREGIRGLYSETKAFAGIRCALEKKSVTEFALFEKDEQDPTICYHLERWLAEQGEDLDDRYTVEL